MGHLLRQAFTQLEMKLNSTPPYGPAVLDEVPTISLQESHL